MLVCKTKAITFTVLLLLLGACTRVPAPPMLEDDGGIYRVSARETYALTGTALLAVTDLEAQSLKAPTITLEIRHYNPLSYGQRARAAVTVRWTDSSPLTGKVSTRLTDTVNGNLIVGWAGQGVNLSVPTGSSSRSVTFYSSYHHQPQGRLCAWVDADLRAGLPEGNDYLTLVLSQKLCEKEAVAAEQDAVLISKDYTFGDVQVRTELRQHPTRGVRAFMRVEAKDVWPRDLEQQNLLAFGAHGRAYTRSVKPTVFFDGAGVAEYVTTYGAAPDNILCLTTVLFVREQLGIQDETCR